MANQQRVSSNFDFMAGPDNHAINDGSRQLDDIQIQVSATNALTYSTGLYCPYLRDTDPRSSITFTFAKKISGFSLDISEFMSGTSLSDFTVGLPDQLFGTITEQDQHIKPTGNTRDVGSLIWSGLDTDTISFNINADPASVVLLNKFHFIVKNTEQPNVQPISVDLEVFAKGAAKKEYIILTNTADTQANMTGVTIKVPTAQKNAKKHSTYHFDDDFILAPGASIRIDVYPNDDADILTFGSKVSMFYDTKLCIAYVAHAGQVIASNVLNPKNATNLFTFQAGDSLEALAAVLYGDSSKSEDIATLNGIDDPEQIDIGAILALPT